MSFHASYEKMANNLKKLGLNESDYAKLDKLAWIVSEKVHGANFSFVYDSGNLKFAKRKEFLSWNDDFFGFQLVVKKLENNVISLFEEFYNEYKAEKIILYGELFGGKYPHPDVKENKDIYPIQTGIYYSPDIEFYAFDLAMIPKGSTKKFYIPYSEAEYYFKKYDLIYAISLNKGKLNEATNFNLRRDSFIPSLLKLPPIKDNLIEGVVIKPYDMPMENHISVRPIIKLKNPEFEEDNAFHLAQKWSYIPDFSSKTEELSYITEEIYNYVNVNRLESAVSKIGVLDHSKPDRISEIRSEFLNDVLNDFNEDFDGITNELSIEQMNWIKNRLINKIEQIISKYEK